MLLQLLLFLSVLLWNGRSCVANTKHLNHIRHVPSLKAIVKYMLPLDYNNQLAPDDIEDIKITFMFFSLSDVAFSNMQFEVEFFFVAQWNDTRINTTIFETHEELRSIFYFEVPEGSEDLFWRPRVVFPTCKDCGLGTVTESKHWLKIERKHKTLIVVLRKTMSFSCHFDLSLYPFDSHECHVTMNLLDFRQKLNLKDVPYTNVSRDRFIKEGMPPEFRLKSLSVQHVCSHKAIAFTLPKDACLQYSIRFKRIPVYHLMLVYCPTVIIIVISWISFWLPVESTAPRISLGMTSLLTMTTQFSSQLENLPPVAYVKGLDVWMIVGVFMVFASLLEFTLAHTFRYSKNSVQPSKQVSDYPKLIPISSQSHDHQRAAHIHLQGKPVQSKLIRPARKEVNWLDAKARIVFPLAFLVFNIIYWPCFALDND